MPIYEYECDTCGDVHEILQKISDKPLDKCQKCSGKLQKLVSHSSFHLKGTGWYVTDYADKSKTSTSAYSSKSNSKSNSKGEASSVSTDKPAKSLNNDS